MLELILVVIFTATANCDNNGIPSLRVVGGHDALPDEYIFVVRIEMVNIVPLINGSKSFNLNMCTGSMITPIWVLTCSHCIKGFDKLWIRYGDMSNTDDLTRTRDAVKLMVYPSYIGPIGIRNDIGLIMVEAVPFDKLARLSMIEYNSLIGLPVKYAGYGLQTFDKANLTLPLQVGDGGVIPCDTEFEDNIPVPAICVAAKCKNLYQFINSGDSGGPLFYEGRIVGIAIAGIRNKAMLRVTHQLFTPISPYSDWIQSVIGS